MNTKVITVGPKEAASVAWSRMRRRGIRHLVVTQNGRLRGVISERDLGGRSGADIRKGRMVEDLMTPRVVSAESKTTLRQAADLMRGQQIGSLPVLDGGLLVGIVTATDVFDELGRSSTRSPFPGWLPRALNRKSGRTDVPLVPAHIRMLGTDLSRDERTSIRQKLRMNSESLRTLSSASAYGAKLQVLHVPESPLWLGSHPATILYLEEQAQKEGEKQLADVEQQLAHSGLKGGGGAAGGRHPERTDHESGPRHRG